MIVSGFNINAVGGDAEVVNIVIKFDGAGIIAGERDGRGIGGASDAVIHNDSTAGVGVESEDFVVV